ncbi:MAG: HsdM family class I SAM-dependent methyltransferase [Promethearchaeota archaeon]
MIANLGVKSEHYKWVIAQLRKVYHELEKKDISYSKHLIKEWKDIYSKIYEKQPSFDIFFNQIYLTIIIKLILFLKFSKKNQKVSDIIYWNPFDINIKEDNFSIDLTKWLASELIIEDVLVLFQKTAEILSNYDLTYVGEDIFRGLYEEIIEQSHRRKLGEYYTPKWLVELILEEVSSVWEKNIPPKILDPACGSGTFLVHSAIYLKERYKLSPKEVTKYITGFDINPIAVIVAKTNLALLLNEPNLHQFQIYTKDALKDYDSNTIDKHDIIVGNPPWIVLRSIKNKDYQNFIKKEMIRYKLINNGDVHLYTQLDASALFFNKCADEHLNKNGIIGFVMPRSVIGSTHQHKNFRKFEHPLIKLIKIIDLEEISPLFNMPSCILIGIKGYKNVYPIPLIRYMGKLSSRDLSLGEAKSTLSSLNEKYIPKINGEKKSYYYDKFKVGLSIFPRSLYFVDLERIRDKIVSVRTSKEIFRIVKEPWKHELNGEIEKDFIFCTLLPWKMVPFGYIEMHPVVLPILPKNGKYMLLDFEDMICLGYTGLHSWFKNAQKIWDNYKTDKAKERFPRLLDRLNYNNLIEFQHPYKRYVVLYNATGKDITSCIIDKENPAKFIVNGTALLPKGFIADVKTWIFETNSQNEAYYLSSILNSSLLSKLIKPFQPRGLYGARAVHRRPLEFSIPKFVEENEIHIKIALLGRNLHVKVQALIQKNISKRQIRGYIVDKISEIDKMVGNLLQLKEVR